MNLLDPCPYAECAAIGEHHHEIARGVVNPYPLPMECPRAASGERCSDVDETFTPCFLPPDRRPMEAPKPPEPMFALSTVEALIRAAIADEREGLGPLPVEYWAEDDDFYWSDDYQDYDMPEDDGPVWDGEFLKRHYYGK